LVVFLAGTGVRPEEGFGAEWRDVDLERRMLMVRRAFARGRLKEYGKTTGSRRAVPLRAKVVAALEQLEHRRGILFRAPKGGRVDINNWRFRHWTLICAVYSYACQEATFGLERNPTAAADRRPEPKRARLDFFSPEEVEALARALAAGAHRDANAPPVSDAEAAARADDDRQDAELVRVAAYTGLRRGEVVALRWRDVDFGRRKIVVSRAVSGSVEATSTKSRRAREVPLPDQAAGALDRLSQRGDFTSPDDYVFVNRLGRRLDGSALRRRVERARDAAGLRPLRFHDLRHTYGSLLVAGGVDLASVKAAMGHSRITTTERYLHTRSASELADRFTRALAPVQADAPTISRVR
jgi:integrase